MSIVESRPIKALNLVALGFDGSIIALFKLGMDTFEISKVIHVRESQIANRLSRLRDAGAV